MEDFEIIDLYWNRDEQAIIESDVKYHHYLLKIAYNVLQDREDSLETLNDTYHKAWNAMPPHRPSSLSLFLGKITRELAIDVYRKLHRVKRKMNLMTTSIDEFEYCIPDAKKTEDIVNLHVLIDVINDFLSGLNQDDRIIFVCRYYYMDSMKDIAKHVGKSQSKIKNRLFKLRKQLKEHLEKEGIVYE